MNPLKVVREDNASINKECFIRKQENQEYFFIICYGPGWGGFAVPFLHPASQDTVFFRIRGPMGHAGQVYSVL